jgi:hypothetical protein
MWGQRNSHDTLLTPTGYSNPCARQAGNARVELIFQTIDNLRTAIEGPTGDWYFTAGNPARRL